MENKNFMRGIVILMALMVLGMNVSAATTASLVPTGNGYYTAWSGSYTDVNEGTTSPDCSDYISESTSNDRESYTINLSSVPTGATITSVAFTIYDRSQYSWATGGTYKTFTRLNAANQDATSNLATSGTSCTQRTQTVDVTDTIKSGTTTLEIGVVKTSTNANTVRVGAISVIITYTPAQCTSGDCCDTATNTFKANTVECRASAGTCDNAETCTGSSASCPTDTFKANTVECRASAGDCDVAEKCSGTGATCPTDTFKANTVECRASAGICDNAETCTGSAATCPTDAFKPASTECRAASGACDIAESCTGSTAACPGDLFQPEGKTCASDPFCSGGNVAEVVGACHEGSCGSIGIIQVKQLCAPDAFCQDASCVSQINGITEAIKINGSFDETNIFDTTEEIYVKAPGAKNVAVYVVSHKGGWRVGDQITELPKLTHVDITEFTSVGRFAPGAYDVIIDTGEDGNGEGDGYYNPSHGDLLDGSTKVIGFEVLPELLTSVLLVAGLVSMVAYTAISRKK
jgi:hypothetical protein